jgi:ParB family chromosome partitioning protein
MADRVGKKRATITNYLRLLRLPAEIQLAIRAGKISMGHAKALLAVDNQAKQLKLCNQIIEQDLSVRASEEKAKKISSPKAERKTPEQVSELDESYFRVIDILGRYFNNNVSLKKDEKGGGSITLRFGGDGEIADFLKALEKTTL